MPKMCPCLLVAPKGSDSHAACAHDVLRQQQAHKVSQEAEQTAKLTREQFWHQEATQNQVEANQAETKRPRTSAPWTEANPWIITQTMQTIPDICTSSWKDVPLSTDWQRHTRFNSIRLKLAVKLEAI